jgi:hypothetical protein
MPFYIRKSVSVGPLRFNLSKSGIGISAGIRGFRVGTGPRGNYVHIGIGGLYYRHTFSSSNTRQRIASSSETGDLANPPDSTYAPMEEIGSGCVSQMVDSNSTALIAELDRKSKRIRIFPFAAAISLIVVALMIACGASRWLIVPSTALLATGVLFSFYLDLIKKSAVIMYELDGDAESAFQKLCMAVDDLTEVSAAWHVNAKGDVLDRKYHAGADAIISRKRIAIGNHLPPFVRTNVCVNRIPVGKGDLYFLPDTVLYYASNGVGAIGYDEIQIGLSTTRMIEEGSVPSDSLVVGRTWRYVNKNGGPDRRFKDNRELPICEYEELRITGLSGLNELLQLSRIGASSSLDPAIRALAASLAAARRRVADARPMPTVASRSSSPYWPEPSVHSPVMHQESVRCDQPAPIQGTPIPSVDELFEALFLILCCVMAADGRASKAEKASIGELMRRAGAPWELTEVADRIARFIESVPHYGYKSLVAEALARVPMFTAVGRQDILVRSINTLVNVDGTVGPSERDLVSKIELTLQSRHTRLL